MLILGYLLEPTVVAVPNSTENPSPRYGGVLRLGTHQTPAVLDPFRVTDTISSSLMDLVFSKLIQKDQKGDFYPDLAERWEISKDGLRYTFYLRKDVRFHNGVRLTSADVLRTFQSLSDPQISPQFSGFFKSVQKWNAPSDFVFEAILREPFSPFLISVWRAWIIPANESSGSIARSFTPVGSGPFKFVRQEENGEISLQANPDYYAGRPYLDGIRVEVFKTKDQIWSAFLRNEIDMIFYFDWSDYKEIEGNPSFQVFRGLTTIGYVLMFNLKDARFSNPKIREAISLAINRQEILEKLENGEGVMVESPFHPESWAYDHDLKPAPYDPLRARALLQSEGFVEKNGILEKDGQPFELHLVVDKKNDHMVRMAKMLRQQLQEIGVAVKPNFFSDHKDLQELVYRSHSIFQSYLFAFNTGTDPHSVASYWKSFSPGNFGFYENSEVDRSFDLASQISDEQERIAYYSRIQKYLKEDKPAVFLYFPYAFHGVSRRIHNADHIFSGSSIPFYQLKDVYIEEALN